MIDIVDMTDGLDDIGPNPYRHLGPCHIEGQLYILAKPSLSLYFARFLSVSPYKGQMWAQVRSVAKRFEDRRIAWEYSKFLSRLPDAPNGETQILCLTEPNPLPYRLGPVEREQQEVNMTAWQYLTTYKGLGLRKR